jgi:glycosyltransferase involved in cell wall biosynthesis
MMLRRKKKLLIFIDWFYPGFRGGGPLDSCKHLADALAADVEVYVLTRNTDLGSEQAYEGITPNVWVDMPPGYRVMYMENTKLSMRSIHAIVRSISPDHIYVNSMFSRYFSIYPLVLNALGLMPSSAIVTVAPRGMLLSSALAKKAMKKTLFLRSFGWLFSMKNVQFHVTNSQEAASVQKRFNHKTFLVADNLPTQEMPPLVSLAKEKGHLRLSYIARIDPIKNLRLFLQMLSGFAGEGSIDLTIGGPIEDVTYWKECEQLISSMPENIRVEYKGPINKSSIPTVIGGSHLYVLLTKGENFGHSIFQALQAGRPVLISDQTPWRELETKGIGIDAPLNDDKEIMRYLCSALSWDQAAFDSRVANCRAFVEHYLAHDRNLDLYKAYFT